MNRIYRERQVSSRSHLCPRIGTYKIIKMNMYGRACGKTAMIATCRWKPSLTASYHPDFKVDIQINSLRLNSSYGQFVSLCQDNIVGMEINVTYASYDIAHQYFLIKWHFTEF